jgi:hypothetical protein
MSKKCPAQRKAFFCFVFFVATKKMKLLSGNPDGFAFIFEFQSTTGKINRLTLCCPCELSSGRQAQAIQPP